VTKEEAGEDSDEKIPQKKRGTYNNNATATGTLLGARA